LQSAANAGHAGVDVVATVPDLFQHFGVAGRECYFQPGAGGHVRQVHDGVDELGSGAWWYVPSLHPQLGPNGKRRKIEVSARPLRLRLCRGPSIEWPGNDLMIPVLIVVWFVLSRVFGPSRSVSPSMFAAGTNLSRSSTGDVEKSRDEQDLLRTVTDLMLQHI
jgi:hypothetical protein